MCKDHFSSNWLGIDPARRKGAKSGRRVMSLEGLLWSTNEIGWEVVVVEIWCACGVWCVCASVCGVLSVVCASSFFLCKSRRFR